LSGSTNKASAAFASSICAFYVLVVIIRKEKRSAVDRRPNGFTKLLSLGQIQALRVCNQVTVDFIGS
jgi:hypothetical protein